MSLPLFYAIYCLEAGLFFTIVPWTRIWTLNSFLHATPTLAILADNPFLRGFVSGLGVVHLLLGIRELREMNRARRSHQQ